MLCSRLCRHIHFEELLYAHRRYPHVGAAKLGYDCSIDCDHVSLAVQNRSPASSERGFRVIIDEFFSDLADDPAAGKRFDITRIGEALGYGPVVTGALAGN